MTKRLSFTQALLPVLFLLSLIAYGLIFRPTIKGQDPFPLEVIFLLASIFAITELFFLGYQWDEIQEAITNKLSKALPTILILFGIGLIIGTWIISGCIPMLVYFGIKMINPNYIYIIAFWVPIGFSSLTGTSWGSVGTIGVVIIGIATVVSADLGITAGAIIGGAYFGDKMSPLSDTTNVAALACDVKLYDHIRSMVNTTVPAALLTSILFFLLGFAYPPTEETSSLLSIENTLNSIQSLFHFSPLLLLPPAIVLYGSLTRKATFPTLLCSALTAAGLAIALQDYNLQNVVQAMYKGYSTEMATSVEVVPESISNLFNRGGLYALNEPIIIAIIVFIYVGAIDKMNAMGIIVGRLFANTEKRPLVILSSLASTMVTNAMTSNQYAASFIVGDAFKGEYDRLKIPRKVLSRSLEDGGTMIESIVPWTTTTVFMSATLGVTFSDYWHWQILSFSNLAVAITLATTSKGCFYESPKKKSSETVTNTKEQSTVLTE